MTVKINKNLFSGSSRREGRGVPPKRLYYRVGLASLFAAAFVGETPADAAEPQEGLAGIPDDYELVYWQDFEGADPLADFVFSDPDGWRLNDHQNDHVLEHLDDYSYGPPHRSARRFALIAGKQFASFVMDLQIRYTHDATHHADQCLFLGFQAPDQFYYIHIAEKQDNVAHHVMVVDEAARTPITDGGKQGGHEWTDGKWRKVRLVRDADSGTIAVYVDDMNEPELTGTDDRFKHGWIGFGSFDRSGAVNNIHVWADPDTVQEKTLDPFHD